MRSRGKSWRGRRVGGYIEFFGLREWYTRLSPEQRKLLRQVRPDIDSSNLSYTSQTAGEFLSSCAGKTARHDSDFAEQLYRYALEIEHDPIHRHFILMEVADFCRKYTSDPARWFEIIQEDLSLLPAFCRTWEQRMSTPLPYYSALSTMLQILRRRGDLPEALSLCKWARELKVAGNWNVQIEELESRMRDE